MKINMKIWVAMIEHRHGCNFYAATTHGKLRKQLYDYAKSWWDSEIPDVAFPKEKTKKQVVEKYFEHVGHESLLIDCVELED